MSLPVIRVTLDVTPDELEALRDCLYVARNKGRRSPWWRGLSDRLTGVVTQLRVFADSLPEAPPVVRLTAREPEPRPADTVLASLLTRVGR